LFVRLFASGDLAPTTPPIFVGIALGGHPPTSAPLPFLRGIHVDPYSPLTRRFSLASVVGEWDAGIGSRELGLFVERKVGYYGSGSDLRRRRQGSIVFTAFVPTSPLCPPILNIVE
jgi:hypothetical protein